MNTKTLILEKVQQLTEEQLVAVLNYLNTLESPSSSDAPEDLAWEAYLQSEQEREEVYQRLADS